MERNTDDFFTLEDIAILAAMKISLPPLVVPCPTCNANMLRTRGTNTFNCLLCNTEVSFGPPRG
jgi:hypothetical protein